MLLGRLHPSHRQETRQMAARRVDRQEAKEVDSQAEVDGLPLYRQEKKLARIGVHLPRSTLAHWMVKAGEFVQPLVNLLRERLLAYDSVCIDETRLQVLKEPGRAAESQS